MHTVFSRRSILEGGDLENRDEYGKIILRWMLEKHVVKMGGE
jgi:hypothetical protein